MNWNNNTSYSTNYIYVEIRTLFQKDSADFRQRKLTMKIGFLQYLRGQKKSEVVFIKKSFEYNLFMGKCPPTVNWAELGIKIVNTLTYI